MSHRTLALSLAAGSAAALAGIARGDEDAYKLRDAQPPVQSRGYIGGVWLDGTDDPDGPFAMQNMILHSWLPLSQMPGSPTSGNDCWGYVSPLGKEIAIVGVRNGFVYVDITNPATPVIVGSINNTNAPGTPVSSWHDVTVIGEFAYGGSEGGAGIQVMDLRQIDSGVVTLVQNRMQGGHTSTHTILSNTHPGSRRLYLCGTNVNNGGLTAVNTLPLPNTPSASATNPVFAGAWTTRYVHECLPVTYTSGPLAGREIVYCFNGGGGLQVVEVTNNGSTLTEIGTLSYPQLAYCHQGWITEDGRYLLVNDELDEQRLGAPTLTRVIDVSNPAAPTLAGSFGNGLTSIDHNLYIRGNCVYEGNYTTGLRVWDISQSVTSPTEIAWIDTRPEGNTTTFNGVWGNYPYFPSGRVIIDDIERGLFVVEVDTAVVQMQAVGTYPTSVGPHTPVPVAVDATPQGGAVIAPNGVKLHVRVDGGAVQESVMSGQGGNRYGASLPGEDCFSRLDFWFSATTTANRSFTLPANAPAEVYSALVLTGRTVFADDAFEVSSGWTGGAPGDTATTGRWNRMDPQPTSNGGQSVQPGDDHTPAPGVNCWVTDGNAGTSVGQYDVDNGFTTLVSPVFNLAGQVDATVSYWRWYSNGSNGPNSQDDTFRVDVTNDGTNWVRVETVGPTGPGTSGGWIQKTFGLASLVAPTATVRFRFIAEDSGQGGIVEAAIDDFRIETVECQTCYPDCDTSTGRGVLDVFDFLCFQNAYDAGSPYACDCDTSTGGGACDVFDFLCFQNAFDAGCP